MRIFLALLLTFFFQLSFAISPEIDAQQKQLQQEEQFWQSVRLPEGVVLPRTATSARKSGYSQVSLHGKNLFFTYVEDLKFDINFLNALIIPTLKDTPVTFNDISTFSINILNGNLLLSSKTLEYIFNRHVLNYAQRPLKNVKISTSGNQLVIDTDLRLKPPFPGAWLKGRIKGDVSLDANQKITIDVNSMEIFGLPLAWAMKLLRLNLNLFITLERPGIALVDRSIKIDLGVLPPPKLSGNLSRVSLEKQGLRLIFSSKQNIVFEKPPVKSNSYLWVQSGDVRIADMVILNGNLQVLSSKPNERLLFNLYDCRKQIAQGFLKITPQGEIIAFLPTEFKS